MFKLRKQNIDGSSTRTAVEREFDNMDDEQLTEFLESRPALEESRRKVCERRIARIQDRSRREYLLRIAVLMPGAEARSTGKHF